VSGPTNKLVPDGNIACSMENLAGFDLGQKLSGIGALAGINRRDLIIEKFTTDLHMAPRDCARTIGRGGSGARLNGRQRHGGRENNLDFKLVATVKNNVATAAAGSAAAAWWVDGRQNARRRPRRPAKTVHQGAANRFTVPRRARNLCRTSAALRPAF